jgi:hypothetical protein
MKDWFANEIERHMFGGGVQTNTTANTSPAGAITAEKMLENIREATRMIDALPKPPMVDLYGHPTITQAYELNWPSNELAWIGAMRRRVIVVPQDQLDATFMTLKQAAVDVRLEPRHRDVINESAPISPEAWAQLGKVRP